MTTVIFHKTAAPLVINCGQKSKVVQLHEQGPPGPPGDTTLIPGTGDRTYIHNQGNASALWTIPHNLNKYPSVTVIDSAGDEVEGLVNHVDDMTLTLQFSAAFSGRAFLN